jgi:hypothetical protein
MQRLALTPVISVAGLWREHQPQRIDDALARLLSRAALTEDTSDLRNGRDDPTILTGLVNDRQIKLLGHATNDTARAAPEMDGDGGKVLEISVASDSAAT